MLRRAQIAHTFCVLTPADIAADIMSGCAAAAGGARSHAVSVDVVTMPEAQPVLKLRCEVTQSQSAPAAIQQVVASGAGSLPNQQVHPSIP